MQWFFLFKERWMVIVCDSKSGLLALSSPRPVCGRVVQEIKYQLAIAHDTSLIAFLVWTPSHFGHAGNDADDYLAKAACALELDDPNAAPSQQFITWQCFEGMQSRLAVFPYSTMTTLSTVVTNRRRRGLEVRRHTMSVLGYGWVTVQSGRSSRQRMCLTTSLVNCVTVFIPWPLLPSVPHIDKLATTGIRSASNLYSLA